MAKIDRARRLLGMNASTPKLHPERRTVVRSHKDLVVWQKAIDLAVLTYDLAAKLPPEERYELSQRLRRSAASISANVAEGHGRGTRKDYLHFLATANGSLMEAESTLILAMRLEYLNPAEAEPAFGLITEISKILTTFVSGCRNKVRFRFQVTRSRRL